MITKNSDRQYPLSAEVAFTYADVASGVFAPAIEVPPGAVVTGGVLVVDTPFNSVTSDTLTVGDAATGDRYAVGVNGAAAGGTALGATGLEYAQTDNVGITWTGVGGAPTQGAGRLLVTYQRAGRANENQG